VVVEDSASDVFLIREALATAAIPQESIRQVGDGEKAVRLFDETDADTSLDCPDLVILDLNLPKRKGSEILAHIRASRRCNSVKVLVVTSSDSARDREEVRRLGCNGYFRKPSHYREFMKLGDVVRDLLTQGGQRVV